MKYEQPILEITKIEITDIIITSGPLTKEEIGSGMITDFEGTGW